MLLPHAKTKLGESNVIKGVCQLICPGGMGISGPMSFPGVGWVSLVPGRLGWVCLVLGPFSGWVGMSGEMGMSGWVGIFRGWVPLTDMIGKWTVRILLE